MLGVDSNSMAKSEIDPWRQRRSTLVVSIKSRALLLGKFIELFHFQKFIHALVEGMPRPLCQFVVADPQLLLPLPPPSCPHPHLFFSRTHLHSTRRIGEHKLLQVTKQNSGLAPQPASLGATNFGFGKNWPAGKARERFAGGDLASNGKLRRFAETLASLASFGRRAWGNVGTAC
jgi:hypothetical protein